MNLKPWFRIVAFLTGVSTAAFCQAPVVTAVTNYQGNARISPSDIVQVFGTWAADASRNFTVTVGGSSGNVKVSWINRGVATELDIEVPADVPVGTSNLVISYLGAASNAFPVAISAFDPVIPLSPFSAFLHLNGTNITPSSPAAPGEQVTTFMTGLGVTNPPSPTGASTSAFVPTATTPTVSLGGKPAPLQFAGFYPGGRTGVYQVTFTAPSGTASGPQPVVVSIGGVDSNAQTLFVGSQALPSPPVISAVSNGASFSTKSELSPGSFFTIYASGLGSSDNLSAFPATSVNGISVLVGGKLASIFSLIASAGQINALVPADADIGSSLPVVVQNQNGPSTAYSLIGGRSGPGIFVVPDPSSSARRNAAATIAGSAWLVIPASQAKALGLPACTGLSQANSCGQPAHPGDFVQLYVTGLGKATPNGDPNGTVLPTGQAAPASGDPLYTAVEAPVVMVGTLAAKVLFAGLAPGYSGLYQIDFQIPAGAPVGDNVAILLSTPGSSLPDSATIAIAP